MKSWKTTLGGVMTSIGVAISDDKDQTVRLVGQVLSILGPLIIGLCARDNKVTSEQAGAAKPGERVV